MCHLSIRRNDQRTFPMNTNGFVWLLSHDEVNQDMARGLGAAHGLDVQVRPLKAGLIALQYRHGRLQPPG